LEIIHYGTRDDSEINVLKCNNCGLVFLSSFDHVDDDFYEDGSMLENKHIDAYLAESIKDDLRRYSFLKEKVIGKKVLDFGCYLIYN